MTASFRFEGTLTFHTHQQAQVALQRWLEASRQPSSGRLASDDHPPRLIIRHELPAPGSAASSLLAVLSELASSAASGQVHCHHLGREEALEIIHAASEEATETTGGLAAMEEAALHDGDPLDEGPQSRGRSTPAASPAPPPSSKEEAAHGGPGWTPRLEPTPARQRFGVVRNYWWSGPTVHLRTSRFYPCPHCGRRTLLRKQAVMPLRPYSSSKPSIFPPALKARFDARTETGFHTFDFYCRGCHAPVRLVFKIRNDRNDIDMPDIHHLLEATQESADG